MFRTLRGCVGPLLLVPALVLLAYANRLVVDDAFIYYRYAEHWLEGLGLVWNPGGEPVEGFTSLPWVYWVAACLKVGIDPALTGLVFFAIALALLWRAAARVAGSSGLALAVVAVYGGHHTISSFATGGLETSLHLMLLAASLTLVIEVFGRRPVRTSWLCALSVVLGLAFVVRMDSAVFIVPLLLGAAWWLRSQSAPWSRWVALAAPAAAIAASFLGLRLLVMGHLVPNTFHAKLGAARAFARGFDYVALFHHDYLLGTVALPACVVGLGLALGANRRSDQASEERPQSTPSAALMAVLGAGWASWCVYVVWIGGDFMEFRMMTPALAPLLLATALAWREAGSLRPLITLALAVILAHEAAIHFTMQRAKQAPFTTLALRQNRYPFYGIPPDADSTPLLRAHLHHPQDDWIALGRRLGQVFGSSRGEVTIATTAAGAVPYFSRLPTVDMLGLNDPWIARHGRVLTARPGHGRGATTDYLLERGVDLVLGHPLMVERERLPQALASVPPRHFSFERAPVGSRLIALPVNDRYEVVMLYLGRNPVVDAAIAREGLPSAWPPP